MADIRQKIGRKYRVLRPQVRSYPSFNVGGGPSDINFVIRGPELEKLNDIAESLRARQDELGLADINTTLRLDKPEVRVVPNRDRCADLGIDARELGEAARQMIGGETQVSRFRDPSLNEDYDVQLRLSEADRSDPKILDRLYFPRKGGGLVQLSNIASLVESTGPSRIDRQDRQRAVAVRGGVAAGYALADRIEALRQATREMNLPAGYLTSISGRGRELEKTFVQFLWAFLLSVIFMYMILASNYESLVHPLTILLSLPLTVPFALLSLYMTGGTLNLYSALGLLVLFGVVKKNSILQIDHMNHLRAEGMGRYQAIIQGNRDRLRPILMTTLALVAGMLPLAIGTGPGAEERRAVAIVVIGGQSLSLLLTLLVTPVAYTFFDDFGNFVRRRKADRHHHDGRTGGDEPAVVRPIRDAALVPVAREEIGPGKETLAPEG
jgi:HAE1 family hydrophobic/amphiphilic exporter-1